MISRCPSCAAEVDDDAPRCPSCHWDFELRKRVPPDGKEAEAPAKPEAKAAPKPVPAIEKENLADSLSTSHTPTPERQLDIKIPVRPAAPKPEAAPPPKPEPAPPSKPDIKPAPSPVDKKPEPEFKLGLKQLPRVTPPEVPGAPPKTEPRFNIPVLPSKKKEEEGPPMTEVRRLPSKPGAPGSGRTPGKKPLPVPSGRTPAPVKLPGGKTPAPDKKTAERGRTPEPSKKDKAPEPGKPGAGVKLAPKALAGIGGAIALIAVIGVAMRHKPAPKAPAPVPPAPVVPAAPPVGQPIPPAPAPPAAPVPAPAPPPAPIANAWTFEGQVYDLITLKGVPGVKLTLSPLGGTGSFEAATDDKGKFKISVAPAAGGGYKLEVTHSQDYLEGYIDEMSPSLREDDLEDRRARAASMGNTGLWIGRPNETVKKDEVLLPKVISADAQ